METSDRGRNEWSSPVTIHFVLDYPKGPDGTPFTEKGRALRGKTDPGTGGPKTWDKVEEKRERRWKEGEQGQRGLQCGSGQNDRTSDLGRRLLFPQFLLGLCKYPTRRSPRSIYVDGVPAPESLNPRCRRVGKECRPHETVSGPREVRPVVLKGVCKLVRNVSWRRLDS